MRSRGYRTHVRCALAAGAGLLLPVAPRRRPAPAARRFEPSPPPVPARPARDESVPPVF